MKTITRKIALTLFVAAIPSSLLAENTPHNADQHKADKHNAADNHKADNTARNEVDKDLNTTLPEDQSNEKAFIERTAAIRREITSREDLSVTAQNIKIITLANGQVVLRGPVLNAKEKETVEKIAKQLSGSAPVKSFIEIKQG